MNVSTLLQDAQALLRSGRTNAAAEKYQQVLGVDPEQIDALRFLGVYTFRNGDLQDCAVLTERAIAVCGDDPILYQNLAVTLRALGRDEEALRAIERSLELGSEVLGLG